CAAGSRNEKPGRSLEQPGFPSALAQLLLARTVAVVALLAIAVALLALLAAFAFLLLFLLALAILVLIALLLVLLILLAVLVALLAVLVVFHRSAPLTRPVDRARIETLLNAAVSGARPAM